jgi:hypothetical protein
MAAGAANICFVFWLFSAMGWGHGIFPYWSWAFYSGLYLANVATFVPTHKMTNDKSGFTISFAVSG